MPLTDPAPKLPVFGRNAARCPGHPLCPKLVAAIADGAAVPKTTRRARLEQLLEPELSQHELMVRHKTGHTRWHLPYRSQPLRYLQQWRFR